MNYIIIPSTESQSSEERTRAFSRELYRLSKPTPTEGDVTEYLFGFVTHPETGETAMECDAETPIPVSQDADATALLELLAPTEEQAEEAEALAGLVDGAKGGQVRFGDIVPTWVTIRSREELDAEGWFPVMEGMI